MISQGYVAVFAKPLNRALISECVESWLNRFESLEQVAPHTGSGPGFTLAVKSPADVMWASDALQFRVLQQGEFTWVYLTQDRRAMETSGMPDPDLTLPLDVLLELPHVTEIVGDHDEQRLDELEEEGLL
ncbi:MAG: hypothetical protein PW734_03935 [Verrucomicrobium sp.]|nr:hypothetical protein [Verrucomicrobium sp.]